MPTEISKSNKLSIPFKWELALFLVLIAFGIFLRMYLLSADPPYRISNSTGIETDPPQYTIFARNDILTGDQNPFQDNRYITYQYSLVSLLSWVVFEIFGIGTYQANLVGVILSLLSILLFYLVLRKTLGNGAALLALLFISVNYIGIFYGRRPFLENGMAPLFIAGICALAYGEKRWWGHFLFGLFTAAAIFFGKIIALAFLGAPIAYYFYKIVSFNERQAWRHFVCMVVGFVSLAFIWLAAIFWPHSESVAGYVGEQAIGLYGYPEGLDSVTGFIRKFLSFSTSSTIFNRMPVISIASLFYIVLLANRLIIQRKGKSTDDRVNPILIVIVVWLAGTYLAEMPWNYQPLRYQTVMVFPLAALAAGLAVHLIQMAKKVNIFNRSPIFVIIFPILLLMLVYYQAHGLLYQMNKSFLHGDHLPYIAIETLVLILLYTVAAWKLKLTAIPIARWLRYALVAAMVVCTMIIQLKHYASWMQMPLFTTQQASRDLGMILSPGAVVSGPYAPALVMDNELGCIIHIFGTSRPDPELFRRFPVTHIAVDNSNETVARDIYPEIMERATFIGDYYLNSNRIKIYSIWKHTGNDQAAAYKPSFYERTWDFQKEGRYDSVLTYIDKFSLAHPHNLTGYLMAGIRFHKLGHHKKASALFTRAAQFSYTDFTTHMYLGDALLKLSETEDDYELIRRGEAEMEMARRLSFNRIDLKELINSSLE